MLAALVPARGLLPILLLPLACAEPSTRATFDPAGDDFWSLPFPSALRQRPDGTFGYARWPQYGERSPSARDNSLVAMWLDAADARLKDGFGVSSGAFFPIGGALDPASLPADPRASLEPSASVYLLDIDPASPHRGERLPVEVLFRAAGDRYAPPQLLAVTQAFGFPRRGATLYAAVVTDRVRDAGGEALGRSEAFGALIDGENPHLAALAATLGEDELEHVVSAAVFRTVDPSAVPRRLAEWTERQPAPRLIAPWRVAEEHASYQVLTSTYAVPVIQTGARPYADLGEGLIAWGADGAPVVQEMQPVRLVVAIPKRPMPAAGFPLTMYLHGSGGEWYEGIDRGPRPPTSDRANQPDPRPGTGPAEWLARRGIAMAGFDFPLHGNRNDPPDRTGLLLYNLFGNIEATIDNYHVTSMELLLLSRMLLELRVDPALAPTLDAGGASELRFDPARLMAMGHSMGSTLGVPWAALDPRLAALFVSGGGGTLLDIAVEAHEPIALKPFVEALVELEEGQLGLDHPLLHAFQNLWDLADPVARARHVLAEPYPGQKAKAVLMTLGVRDGYFAPRAQAALATPLGVRLFGDPVEPLVPAALALAGREAAPYPAQPDGQGRFAAAAHYEVPFELGHYVAFDLESTRAQYTCFLASVGAAAGPRLPAPAPLDAPCP